MADKRNRTPFYGAVPTSKLQADHIFMADGSTLQELVDEQFELIETITTEEDVNTIEITFSQPVSEFIAFIETAASTTTGTVRVRVWDGTTTLHSDVVNTAISTIPRYFSNKYISYKGIKFYSINATTGNDFTSAATLSGNVYRDNNITKLEYIASTASVLIPAGSVVEIYGIYA